MGTVAGVLSRVSVLLYVLGFLRHATVDQS